MSTVAPSTAPSSTAATAGSSDEAVAITGMACLFPGAPDLDAYWRNILGGVEAISDPPPESWDPSVYYDPGFADSDRTYCRRGGYLGPLAAFDPLPFGIPPLAVGGEPDQWLALNVAREALLDAGASDLPDDVRARTAIVLGKGTYLNGGNAIAVQRGLVVGQTIDLIRQLHPEHTEEELAELREELKQVLPPLTPDTVPGLIPNITVGRIANRLDLMGPAYTVDAACASSLVAVGHAMRDLVAGECDLALAGGSQVWMPVATLNLFCRLGALSHRQQLRAFDKDADGTLLGEGIGMVVLKRLADAVRDEDRVYAVLRGVGVSSDGRGLSVMAPRAEGEELALRRAYERAGVSPRSVGLIEAHGTGTPVGDVTEVRSLTAVFGERDGELPRCALGSVKSMISHTIPAAGVAGLIKTALALHQRVLPPTLHCDAPNPDLELERTPFYINTETRPWIHGGREPRRAGVNAFGFGGINAHAVLEEFAGPRVDHRPPWETELCLLEAESAAALADRAATLADALNDAEQFTLADLARTLAAELGETPQPQRLAIVASSVSDLHHKLGQAIDKLRAPGCSRIRTTSGIYYESRPLGRDAKCAFIFPGEGAQYPGMLAGLCRHFDEARAVFDRIDRLYVDHPRGHLLSDWVFPRPAFSPEERAQTTERLMELDIAVESVLTANAAAYAVLSRLMPQVDAMVGHSTGEHSAAMAAGALDLETDERLATFCHGLHGAYADAAARHEVPGAVLLALGTDAESARRIAGAAGDGLYLAMDNCPHQVVLVGDAAAGGRARELAAAEGIVCEQLPYDRAVHTPLFAPFAGDLRAVFDQLPVRSPAAGLWSCTTAAPCPADPGEIRELLVEHWTRPVRFRETIEALHEDGVRVFVEAGPRGNLTAFVQDILRGREFCAAAADMPRRAGVTQLNHLAAMLAVHHVELDAGYLFKGRGAGIVDWRAPTPTPVAQSAAIPLATSWPMLRLSDETVQRWHSRRPAAVAAASPPVAPSAAPVALMADGLVRQPEPLPPPAGAPDIDETGVPADDDLATVLGGHLSVMERFLSVSADVVSSYLGSGAAVLAPPERPLVGEIVTLVPGEELVARRVVDRAEDAYLRDHSFAWAVSRCDPGLAALTVMPLAMSMEILAEAAALAVPDGVVTGMRDLRGHRWLEVGEAPVALEIRAHRFDDDDDGAHVHVELHEVGGAEGPVVEATVRLGAEFPPAPLGAVPPPAAEQPPGLAGGRLYGEVLFHGPLWQAIESVDSVGEGGVQARLRVLPRVGLLRSVPAPEFVLDPVAIDAAGQLVGVWAAATQDRGRIVFPFRLEELEVFGPPPAEGALLPSAAAIERRGDRLTSSQIEITDGDGRCWVRLRGWEDRRFDVADHLRPLTVPARLASLSAPWPAPVSVPRGADLQCRRLEATIGEDSALWTQIWASRVLGRRERALFAGLSGPEVRRLEWLAARTAAKEAVGDLLGARGGASLPAADIEILPGERGEPRVEIASTEPSELEVRVALTHAHGRAAAAAIVAEPGVVAGVGIDIEVLHQLPEGFADIVLGAEERDLFADVAPHERNEWLLRSWCAKEAAGKAVGEGMGMGSAPPVLTQVVLPTGAISVQAGGRRVAAQTWRDAEVVAAVAILADGGTRNG